MANELKDRQMMQKLQNVDAQTLRSMADELIEKQKLEQYNRAVDRAIDNANANGDYIKFNKYLDDNFLNNGEFQNHQESVVKVNGEEIKAYDMDYYIAESLQKLQAGESPEAEYYDWVDQERKIEEAMASNKDWKEVHSDMKDCGGFISMMDDRETELKRIIVLYSGAAFNTNCEQNEQARTKLKFLVFKLSELRRLREKAQNLRPAHPRDDKQDSLKQQFAANAVRVVRPVSGMQEYLEEVEGEENTIAGNVAALHMLHIQGQASNLQELRNPDHINNSLDDHESMEEKRQRWAKKLMELSGRVPNPPKPVRPRGFDYERYRRLTEEVNG